MGKITRYGIDYTSIRQQFHTKIHNEVHNNCTGTLSNYVGIEETMSQEPGWGPPLA